MIAILLMLMGMGVGSPQVEASERVTHEQKQVRHKEESLAKPIEAGECSETVEELGDRLVQWKYLSPRMSGDCYTEEFSHAVMALQKWEGIDRDGVYGPQTAKAAASAKRPQAPHGGSGTRIDISLSHQLAFVVRDDKLKRVISISSGSPGYDTPVGDYSVFRKEEMSWSVPYETWMPWASYFNGGIALHESDSVPGYPASHGCVRVPAPFAHWVYQQAEFSSQVRVLA